MVTLSGCTSPRSEAVSDDAAAELDGPASAEDGPAPASDASAAPDSVGGGRPALADPFIPIDGTRLKGRWAEAPGTQRLWLGWYDTELATPCAFALAGDGEMRCLPPESGSFGLAWLDANCTVPLADRVPSCASPGLVSGLIPAGCGQSAKRIYRRDAISEGQAYSTGSGVCMLVPVQGTRWRVGPELPPGTFVKAVEASGPLPDGAAGMEPVILEGEDGSRGFARWQLASSKEPCFFLAAQDGRARCLARVTNAGTFHFADAQCLRETASHYLPACQPRPSLVSRRRSECPDGFEIHALGPRLDQGFRKEQDGSCVAVPLSTDWTHHALGERLSDDSFPALDVVPDPGGAGRLRAVWNTTIRGRRILADEWFDSSRRQLCRPTLLAGGTVRCAPGSVERIHQFSDPGCTRPLYRELAGYPACPPPTVILADDACPRRHRSYTVGARYQGPVFSNIEPLTCGPAYPSNDVYFEMTPIPETELAEVTVREP